MAAIYIPTRCLQKLEAEYKRVFDYPLNEYQITHRCAECDGEPDKECNITLDKLVKRIDELEQQKWS